MATETGQPAHISSQSQQGLISGDQYAPVQLVETNVDTPVPTEAPPNTKKRLIIIGIIAVIIIVAVIILAVVIEFGGLNDSDSDNIPWRPGGGDCGCWLENSTFYHQWDQVCGMSAFQFLGLFIVGNCNNSKPN